MRLDIQNNEKKAFEELINHKISNSKHCVIHTEEDIEYICTEERHRG